MNFMPSSHGTRRKSRSILTKDKVARGISYLLIDYKEGDKVIVDVDPREHNTIPHRRFQGKVGIIKEVGRRTIKLAVMVGEKQKLLNTKLNHVKPLTAEKENSK